DDDAVGEGVVPAQVGEELRDRGTALTYGAVHAQDILASLVQDRIQGNGGLARLTVAQNQLALAVSDRQQRIDHLQAGLQRLGHRRPARERRRGPLDRASLVEPDRAVLVERPAEGVDDATDERLPDRYVQDAPGAVGEAAGGQVLTRAEQDHAELFRVQVVGEP